MKLKELIKLRDEIEKNNGFDYKVAKGQKLLSLTYPSQLIKEIIEIIDFKLKNVQLRSSRQALTVLQGAYGTGKTHALIIAYLLFNDFELTYSWMEKNSIKFNKFNAINIKSSKSCFLSALKEDTKQLWKTIFAAFDREDLLIEGEVPDREKLDELIADQYTAIFIDDLVKFFLKLKKQQEVGLFKANKLFIKNLFQAARKNNKLILFMTATKEFGPFVKLFSNKKVVIKKTEKLCKKKSLISHYLFNGNKDKAKIELKINQYLELYNKTEINFADIENIKKQLLDYFPFQPKLVKIIDDIYKNNADSINNVENQLALLGDLCKENYDSENLITIPQVNYRLFETAFPHLTNSLKISLALCQDKKLWQSILKIIYFNTLTSNKDRVEEKELIKLLSNQNCLITFAELNNQLEAMTKQLKYLKGDISGYYLKPKKDIATIIKEKAISISNQLTKNKMIKYLKEEFLSKRFKIYGYNDWEDNKNIKYIIFPEISADKAKLKEIIEENFSFKYTYQNTFIFIMTDEKIFADKYLKQMKKIIAIQRLIAESETDKKINKLKKEFRNEKEILKAQLAKIFNSYYYWIDKGDRLDICQRDISVASLDDLETELKNKIKDKSVVKEYIINQGEERFLIDLFLEGSKQYRGMPFIWDKHFFFEVINELIATGELFFNQKTNKAYKSFSSWLAEKEIKVDESILKKQLISAIKKDVFSQEYKIYGLDQLADTPDLDYVLILDNIEFEVEKIKKILNEDIYSKYNFKNSFVFIKPREKIFIEHNILMAKKIAILKEASSQEIGQEIKQTKIELIEKKLAFEISARFGDYLQIEERSNELLINEIEFEIDIDQTGNIIDPKSKLLKYFKKMDDKFNNIITLSRDDATEKTMF